MTNKETVASAIQHFKATKVDYPTWLRYVQQGRYSPPDGSGTEWGKGFALLAQVQDVASPAPEPAPTPTGYNWVGDFRAGSLDGFDTHDANVAVGGTTIVSKQAPFYTASQKCARMVASDSYPSTSVSGAGTMLWASGEYGNPWAQKGSKTWYRMTMLLPDGTDTNYPGRFVSQPTDGLQNTWRALMEWHIADAILNAHGGFTSHSSTAVSIAGSNHGGPCLLLRPIGGKYGATVNYYIKQTDKTQTKANSGDGNELGIIQKLQYNHWYDILVYQEFDADPTIGYMEWWVDGVKCFADHLPTLTGAQDGTQPGVGFEGGLYRSFTAGEQDETVYMGAMVAGPTRLSVGA